MEALLQSLLDLLIALWGVLKSLGLVLLPWIGLAAWIAYWLFAVNWTRLRTVLLQGGLIGVLLIGFVMIVVWGVVAPPSTRLVETADGRSLLGHVVASTEESVTISQAGAEPQEIPRSEIVDNRPVHDLLGLKLSNYVGKTVYVTTLFVIMFLCGSVQLAGCCASCCQFDEPAELEEHGHAAHAH